MIVLILSVLVALSVSATCSLLEATLLSLTPSQVGELARKNPGVGERWRRFKADVQKPIAVILILNTAAHTIGATIAGAKFEEFYGEGGIVAFSIVFTFLMLQFTEILPKTLGVRYNRRLAPVIAGPLAFLIGLLSPVLTLIHLINRPFGRRRGEEESEATIEELTALAGLARLSNLIGSHEEKIIKETTELSRQKVREIMIPVEDVVLLSTDQPITGAIATAQSSPHTRFPVCEGGDPDLIIGYLNFKDLVSYVGSEAPLGTLEELIRPIHAASPEQSASDLLRVYVERHVHIAIVRDEEGKVLGLVTLEDIIEELVGELQDEYPIDRLPRLIQRRADGSWLVGGGVPIGELAERLGIAPPGPATASLSTWLTQRLGRPPRPGDSHAEDGLTADVRRVRRGQVFEALVRPEAPGHHPPGA
jgi:CBS domain containing-hemolysin-like protein